VEVEHESAGSLSELGERLGRRAAWATQKQGQQRLRATGEVGVTVAQDDMEAGAVAARGRS
jgi:hypothetical protein